MLIAFQRQQWLSKRALILRYAVIACIALNYIWSWKLSVFALCSQTSNAVYEIASER